MYKYLFLICGTDKRSILENDISVVRYNLLSEYDTDICRRITTLSVKIRAISSKTNQTSMRACRHNIVMRNKDF